MLFRLAITARGGLGAPSNKHPSGVSSPLLGASHENWAMPFSFAFCLLKGSEKLNTHREKKLD